MPSILTRLALAPALSTCVLCLGQFPEDSMEGLIAVLQGGPAAASALAEETLSEDPRVVSVSPLDGATGVPTSPGIVVNLSAAMDSASLNAASGSGLCNASVQISSDNFASCREAVLTLSADGQTLTIAPTAPLHAGTSYRLRITADALSLEGRPLEPFESAFTTAFAPTTAVVVQVTATPSPQYLNSGTVAVQVNWSEAVTLTAGPATIALANGGTLSCPDAANSTIWNCTYTINVGDGETNDLGYGAATIAGGTLITDSSMLAASRNLPADGGAVDSLQDTSEIRIDRTGPSVTVTPNAGSSFKLKNSSFIIAFNEPIPGLTHHSANLAGACTLQLRVTEGGSCVGGQLYSNFDNTVFIFDPNTDFGDFSSVAVEVAGTVTDLAGNALATYNDTFFIGNVTGPVVSSIEVSPNPGASVYNSSQTFTIHVNFSGVVGGVNGTPVLDLNSGGQAVYVTGAGTATLEFTYTPAAGDHTPWGEDLDVASQAALRGDIEANLLLPAAGNPGRLDQTSPGIEIDAVAPTDVSAGSFRYESVDANTVRLSWAGAQDPQGDSSLLQYEICQGGAGGCTPFGVAATSGTLTYNATVGAGVLQEFGVRARDPAGNVSATPAILQAKSVLEIVAVAGSFNGGLGGLAGADALCPSAAYRAWLVSGPREAPFEGGTQWPLRPNQLYVRAGVDIGRTDGGSLFQLPLINGLGSGTGQWWTGMRANQGTAAERCNEWNDGTAAETGQCGLLEAVDSSAFASLAACSCDATLRILCVEQL